MLPGTFWFIALGAVAGIMSWLAYRVLKARPNWKKWPGALISGLCAVLALSVLLLGLLPVTPEMTPTLPKGTIGAQGPAPTTELYTDTQHHLPVHPGESIQAVIDSSRFGDTIEVFPGVYHEALKIDKENITLLGVVAANGQYPVLDGLGQLGTAVLATANFFTIEQFQIRDYTENGVETDNIYDSYFRNLLIAKPGQNGIFTLQNTHVLIQNVKVSGANGAGISINQSRNVLVQNSETFDNTSGIEIDRSVNSEVQYSYSHDNTLGILVWDSPVSEIQANEGHDTKIWKNRVENNNLASLATQDYLQAIPPGIGIMVMSGPTEVAQNTLSGNNSSGVGVARAANLFDDNALSAATPRPEKIWLHDNQYAHNGEHPAGFSVQARYPGADILWDGSGWNNRFDDREVKTFPPLLPSSAWPDLFKRALWQFYRLLY